MKTAITLLLASAILAPAQTNKTGPLQGVTVINKTPLLRDIRVVNGQKYDIDLLRKYDLASLEERERTGKPLFDWHKIEIYEVGTVSRGAAICLAKIADGKLREIVVKNIPPSLPAAQAEYQNFEPRMKKIEDYIKSQRDLAIKAPPGSSEFDTLVKNIDDAEKKLKETEAAKLKAFATFNALCNDYAMRAGFTAKHEVWDLGIKQP